MLKNYVDLFYLTCKICIGLLSCHEQLNEKLALNVSELNEFEILNDYFNSNDYDSDLVDSKFYLIQMWSSLIDFMKHRFIRINRFLTARNIDENSNPIKMIHTLHPKNYLKAIPRDMEINSTENKVNNTTFVINHFNDVHNVKTGIEQNASKNRIKDVRKNVSSDQIKQTIHPQNILKRIFRNIKNKSYQGKNNTTVFNHFSTNVNNLNTKTGIIVNEIKINPTQDNEKYTTIIRNYSKGIYNVGVKTGTQQNSIQTNTRNFDKKSNPIKRKYAIYPKIIFGRYFNGIHIKSPQKNKNNTTIINNYSNNLSNVSLKAGIQQHSSQSNNTKYVDQNSTSNQLKQTVYPKNSLKRISRGIEINSTQNKEKNTTIMNKYSTDIYNTGVKYGFQQNSSRNTASNAGKNASPIRIIKSFVYPKNIFKRIFKRNEINSYSDNENNTTIMNEYSTDHIVSLKTDMQPDTYQSITPEVVETQKLMNSKIDDTKMLKLKSNIVTFATPLIFHYNQKNKADTDKISDEIPSSSLFSYYGELSLNCSYVHVKII